MLDPSPRASCEIVRNGAGRKLTTYRSWNMLELDHLNSVAWYIIIHYHVLSIMFQLMNYLEIMLDYMFQHCFNIPICFEWAPPDTDQIKKCS